MPLDIKRRKILIAGGSGLLGSHLVARLVEMGADVVATCFRREPPFFEERYRKVDLTQFDACLTAAEGVEMAIFCAGYSYGVQARVKNPMAGNWETLEVYLNLLEACRQKEVQRVVFLSSSTVYPVAEHPIREDELDLNVPPFELYGGVGQVWRFLEHICHFYHQRYALPIGILRPSNIYGPRDHFEDGKAHVLPALIKRALRKEEPFIVWGDGRAVRDFIFVEDVVEAVLLVLEKYCVCDPLNIGYGQGVTVREAAELVLELCGHPVRAEYDASKPVGIPYRVLDMKKFDALFGNKLRISLREGLRKTVAWYRSVAADEKVALS